MKRYLILLMLAGAAVAGCSTNGSEINPSLVQANVNNDKLEFAVGTANFQGTTYLNTVVSLRQASGASAVLLDTPTITGPAGFTVPAVGSAGTDAGTNRISGTPQSVPTNPYTPPPVTTFNQSGGAFSYGFAPFNSGTTGAALYPGNPPLYSQPFYIAAASKLSFYGGPPAFPFFNDGTYPSGFLGYSQGFTMFGATPVGGAYTLSVLVPAANAAPVTLTASANLNPAIVVGVPVITGVVTNGAGGLTGTITPGTGATESLVYIQDVTAGLRYTVGPIAGTAPAAFTLPNTLGPCSTRGCGATDTTPSIAAGDTYRVYAASFDYPAYESAPPISTSATPTIIGGNGQADIGVSTTTSGTY
ncbi:MAG: hypothetical protein ABR508_07705 [Candidatus Baltobacteraceae bacterium]